MTRHRRLIAIRQIMDCNIARLEDRLIVISRGVGTPAYDFNFDMNFSCTHPYQFKDGEICVLRIGPIIDYEKEYSEKIDWGLRPINSPQDHLRASELEIWYPLISDLTPKSLVFESLPVAEEVESCFGWPVFVKGSRQTSRHNPALSKANGAQEYMSLCAQYMRDPILHWQRPVIRQFVDLDPVAGEVAGKIRPSCEFRTFWWNGEIVGCGQYWYQVAPYKAANLDQGVAVAREAARRIGVPFLVVDIARKSNGDWIVIEANDAQESGHSGIPPHLLWRNILDRI